VNRCARPGCIATVPTHILACRADWYALPAELRRAVGRAWRRLLDVLDTDDVDAYRVAGAEHEAAKAECVAWWQANIGTGAMP
jgi:hypothetical protein